MKILLYLLFFYSNFSYSQEISHLNNFLMPMTECKNMEVGLYSQKQIEENSVFSFLLVCRSSHYFLNCVDSYNNEISLDLTQYSDEKYIYKNENTTLILDEKNKMSIINQHDIKRGIFSNLMCKSLFYKNFNKVLPNVYLNNGIKGLINKGDSNVKQK